MNNTEIQMMLDDLVERCLAVKVRIEHPSTNTQSYFDQAVKALNCVRSQIEVDALLDQYFDANPESFVDVVEAKQ